MTVPKLSSDVQYKIEVILTRWRTKLSWDLLTEKIKFELGISITRQALCSYVAVNEQFKLAKLRLRIPEAQISPVFSASVSELCSKIEDLKAQLIVLKRNNAEQLRMLERILANASMIPNLDLRDLLKIRPEEMS
ncbi:hypothetical protein [Pseudomonas coronafaciens]|uniref:Uncharacterized protein n=1 Tax=Pseudomonas coronafaciens pv. coronafaciens TaxID=235275 RepID=A0AAE6QGJ7_9PSED|nr:hypothetical protein [Pseudomonas coronafaciens]QGT82224.1 hypothetical protein GMO17_14085 [Pseudomonas coronafaciens pv. coronafaciens]